MKRRLSNGVGGSDWSLQYAMNPPVGRVQINYVQAFIIFDARNIVYTSY